MNKKPNFAKLALHIIGLLFCVLPPSLATICYFPIWSEKGSGYTLAGGGILLVILACIPIYRYFKQLLRSPASYVIWLVLFLIFAVTARIAEEMTVIAFFGFVGNLIGALCFYLARRRDSDGEGA